MGEAGVGEEGVKFFGIKFKPTTGKLVGWAMVVTNLLFALYVVTHIEATRATLDAERFPQIFSNYSECVGNGGVAECSCSNTGGIIIPARKVTTPQYNVSIK